MVGSDTIARLAIHENKPGGATRSVFMYTKTYRFFLSEPTVPNPI